MLLGVPYVSGSGQNYTFNETALVDAVDAVKDHPALVAYYVCDDCCKGDAYTVALAGAYEVLRRADPFHPTTGAFECGEFHSCQAAWT